MKQKRRTLSLPIVRIGIVLGLYAAMWLWFVLLHLPHGFMNIAPLVLSVVLLVSLAEYLRQYLQAR